MYHLKFTEIPAIQTRPYSRILIHLKKYLINPILSDGKLNRYGLCFDEASSSITGISFLWLKVSCV